MEFFSEKKNAYVNFIRDFKLDNISEKAQIFICADTEYALGITSEFMRGETDVTDNYKSFPLCRGKVETLKGEKEIVKQDSAFEIQRA